MAIPNWLQSLLDLLFGGGSGGPTTPPPPPPTTPPGPTPTWAEQMLRLHNDARSGVDLKLHPALMKAAQDYALVMAFKQRMGHSVDGTTFSQRARAAGYSSPGGENVAWGYDSVQSVFNGWMTSPGHRANITNRSFRDAGFGMALGGGRKYWCAVFGYGVGNVAEPLSTEESIPLIHPSIKTKRTQQFIRSALPHGRTVLIWEEVE